MGVFGLGMRWNNQIKEQQNTNPIRSIYGVFCGGVSGERKSHPLICKSLLVHRLLDNDESKYLTNLWGHQICGNDLLVSF